MEWLTNEDWMYITQAFWFLILFFKLEGMEDRLTRERA